jgi:hypothetical protein
MKLCAYKIGRLKDDQSQMSHAVYLTLFNATCFGFFYKAIIRQHEILKQGSSCTIPKLCYNMQLRQLMYKMEAKMDKIMQVSSKNIMYFIDHINKL